MERQLEMSPPKFEIFKYFLRSYVLSRSETRKATSIPSLLYQISSFVNCGELNIYQNASVSNILTGIVDPAFGSISPLQLANNYQKKRNLYKYTTVKFRCVALLINILILVTLFGNKKQNRVGKITEINQKTNSIEKLP